MSAAPHPRTKSTLPLISAPDRNPRDGARAQPTPMSTSAPLPRTPAAPPPTRLRSIHNSTECILALIDAEIHAHTAAARRELAGLRAQRQTQTACVARLVAALALFGVTCRRDGAVSGCDGEWRALFDVLDAADSEADSDAEDGVMGDAADPSATQVADPIRELGRVRRLLERKQAKAKRWKERCLEN